MTFPHVSQDDTRYIARPLAHSTRQLDAPDKVTSLDSIMLDDGVTLLPVNVFVSENGETRQTSIAEDMEYYASTALRTFTACVRAGANGGLAAYVHECRQVGLTGVLPDSVADTAPRPLREMLREIAPDVTSDSYVRYWSHEHIAGLILDGGTLRKPAFSNLFSNILERILTFHNVQTFQPVLRDLARAMKDGQAGKLGLPAGTWSSHVLVSLYHLCLQAWALYDDTDGEYSDMDVGARRYRLAVEELDARETRGKQYHHAMHQSECPLVRAPKQTQVKKQNSNLTAKRRRLHR